VGFYFFQFWNFNLLIRGISLFSFMIFIFFICVFSLSYFVDFKFNHLWNFNFFISEISIYSFMVFHFLHLWNLIVFYLWNSNLLILFDVAHFHAWKTLKIILIFLFTKSLKNIWKNELYRKFIEQKLVSVVSFENCKEISKNMQILRFEIKN